MPRLIHEFNRDSIASSFLKSSEKIHQDSLFSVGVRPWFRNCPVKNGGRWRSFKLILPTAVALYNIKEQVTTAHYKYLNRATNCSKRRETEAARRHVGGRKKSANNYNNMPASSSPTRRRRNSKSQTGTNNAAFSQHQQQDDALGVPAEAAQDEEGMSFVAKALIFLAFPLLTGMAGLYIGYIRTIRDSSSKIDFDTDFVFPFLLALALVVVIAFQTKGFTKKKITPLIQWPTVRRKKKIIRKRIIVDEDGNEIKEEGKEE